MKKTYAKQMQIEVNQLLAAIDRDEPTPLLIARLTTIIAICQASIATSAFPSLLFDRGDKEKRSG